MEKTRLEITTKTFYGPEEPSQESVVKLVKKVGTNCEECYFDIAGVCLFPGTLEEADCVRNKSLNLIWVEE
jgi:hypothetical protein